MTLTGLGNDQLVRYSRQLLLPQIQVDGQRRLLDGHALIVGAGGLGSPAALYLAALGVGTLTVADGDSVELSNLHRQILHGQADIGRPKAESARDAMLAHNPDTRVHVINERLTGETLSRAVTAADVVLDGCDNFATRFAVNEACMASGTPLVSGAAVRLEGQVGVFRPDRPDSPCYRCLYEDAPEPAETCAANGILPPVVGIIGSVMAAEAVKLLAGFGETLTGRLLILDSASMSTRTLRLRRDPECPVCAAHRAAAPDTSNAAES